MRAKYKVTYHPVWWDGRKFSADIAKGERLGYVINGVQVKAPVYISQKEYDERISGANI